MKLFHRHAHSVEGFRYDGTADCAKKMAKWCYHVRLPYEDHAEGEVLNLDTDAGTLFVEPGSWVVWDRQSPWLDVISDEMFHSQYTEIGG